MKQANHAPQPLWRRRLPGYAAMGAATLAMALGLHGLMSARTTVAGTFCPWQMPTPLPMASARCTSWTRTPIMWWAPEGFQSDVEAGVTLDSTGNVQSVAILAQGETDTLGGQCVDPEFTSQYQGAAPFALAGKAYTVTDPATGTSYAAAGSSETEAPAEDFDPANWRVSDASPEAEATRKMYEAGLTLSALNGQPLDDELAPPLDSSAEAVARRKLYAAGLSKSAQDGEDQASPFADWSAEKQAAYRLEQAELTTSGEDAGAASADLTEVDALTGATITSTAVTNIVNNSYFYVTEVLSAE